MRFITRLPILFTLVLFACQTSRAAVVEVEVTIKAVTPQSRGITVAYPTSNSEKTTELDVSRKAEITVNGKPGTLDLLKPGQKAKVTFEKELQIVTKIDATGRGTVAREVYRLTLQLSEFGDGKIRFEKTSQPPADDFPGTPFKFSNWPHTKATKGQGGMFRLVHDFSDPDDLGVLTLPHERPLNVAIDREGGCLLFTPKPSSPQDRMSKASFIYGKKIRLPLTVVCDVVEYGNGGLSITVNNLLKRCHLEFNLWSKELDLEHPFEVEVNWNEVNQDDKQRNRTILWNKKDATSDHPIENKFRLPLPNARITDPMLLSLGRFLATKPSTVSRLEVRGRIVPMFGMELADAEGLVFVKSMFPNGVAEKAGMQPGDVISAVNGKRPKTMTEAMEMFSRLPIGEKAVFAIQRGEKAQELRVVAE